MRIRLVGPLAVAAVVLPFLASPSTAATRVDGDRFGVAGIRIASQGCVDPALRPSRAAKLDLVKDRRAPLGQGAAGWVSREASYVTGPLVHINRPGSLKKLQVSVRRVSTSLSGQALVRYTPSEDTGQWWGSAVLPNADRAGWRSVRGETLLFRWRHYASDGQQDQFGPVQTIQDFVADNGGNGDGAWVGFGFGCNQDAFRLDALKVVTSRENKTFNFEPSTAKAKLLHVGSRKATLIAGGTLALKASLKDMKGRPVRGRVVVQRAVLGHKKYEPAGRFRIGKTGKTLQVSPLKSSRFRLKYLGSKHRVSSVSKPLTVRVHTNVRARLASGSVTVGSRFRVSGRFWPGRATRVVLQKYIGGKWQAAKRFRSSRDGAFAISVGSPRIGKSYWRIYVPKSRTNLDGRSPAMRLTVKPKQKPPHQGGGSPSPPTDPTPPPVIDPQPPPPPPGPQ